MSTYPDDSTQSNDTRTGLKSPLRQNTSNPFIFMWMAVFFVIIDFFAFQKPLSNLMEWILIVIPLLFLAVAFLMFARLKKFPYLPFPFDSLFMGNVMPESSNVVHSLLFFLAAVIAIVVVTITYLGK